MGAIQLTAATNRIKAEGFFACGNLPQVLATTTDAGVTTTYTCYTWNVRNQLTGLSKTGFTASFTYDSLGRRTGKTINGTTTNFVYDGLNPVQEKAGAIVNANLLTELGIDEFFTRTDGIGVRALLPDALGSTVGLGDGTGEEMGSLLDLAPLSTITDPLNHTTTFGYDTKGNLTTITNALNKTTIITVNAYDVKNTWSLHRHIVCGWERAGQGFSKKGMLTSS
jgi:YD repeat-containing protein